MLDSMHHQLVTWRTVRFAVVLSCLLLLALSVPQPAEAQVLYSSVTGTVVDPTGAAVPNATVEALNTATALVKRATTDERGSFLISDLPPGTYNVTVSAPAFSRHVEQGLVLEPNQTRRIEATLRVAQVTESVVVNASADALQTDRADVNVNLSSTQIVNLPLGGTAGRNYQGLMAIVPGAIMSGEQNSDAGQPQRSLSFNVNGVSRLQNNTKVDGASMIYPWLPANTVYVPSTESIETVNIVTNSFNAEQGMAGGAAVTVIVKSGTNDLHGTGWLFNQTDDFKARNTFQTTPQNPKNIINQFGGNIGGPVYIPKVFNGKNKLFFFVNWERTTRRQSSPIVKYSLPPADLRAGNFTGSGINTVIYDPASSADPKLRTPFPGNQIPSDRIDIAATEMMKLMPSPNITGAGYTQNYFAQGALTYDRNNYDFKINEHVSDKLSWFGKYSISPSLIYDPPALGAAGGGALGGGQLGTAPGRVQVAGAGLTYTITPTLIFDGNLGYTRQRLGAEWDLDSPKGLDLLKIPGTNGDSRMYNGLPSFSFTTFTGLGNTNTGNPFLFRDNQYIANANVGWNRGAHAVRFGFDYMNQQINHFQPQGGAFQGARGSFVFDGQATALQNGTAGANMYNSWAAFLLGLPSRAGSVFQFWNPNSVWMKTYAFYAQDTWQATRKLTLTLGLRWEDYPFPTRDHGGVSRFDPTDGNIYFGGVGSVPVDTGASTGPGLFLPRLGIAYRLDDKTVIRSGYGMSADPRPYIDFRSAYPVSAAWEMPAAKDATGKDNTYLPVTTLRQGLVGRPVLALGNGIMKLPSNTGTTTWPKDVMRKYIQSWNFMVERELPQGFMAQAGYVGTRATGAMGFMAANWGYPGLGNAGRILSKFGLTADVNIIEPFKTATYDALQTQLTRKWKASQLGIVYTFSKALNYQDNDGGPRIQYPGAWQQNRGLASFNRTHNFQTYWVVDSPFGKNGRWLKDGIGGKVLGGWQLNGILTAQSGLPVYVTQGNAYNLNAPSSSQVPDQVKATVAILGGVGKGHPYFDTTAFQEVKIAAGQPQRFGNAGRNNVIGPGLFNTDASLFRDIPAGEHVKVQLRCEAMNVFNHPNYALGLQWDGNSNVNDGNFGIITYTVGPYNATGNAGKGTGERQFRFAIRVSF